MFSTLLVLAKIQFLLLREQLQYATEHPSEDEADLCLSFTSAGMSERETLPVASENKSGHFGSNSGQLHLLHPFIVVWLQSQSVTLPPKGRVLQRT